MGVRQLIFGKFLERLFIIIFILFIILSIVIIIKNKIDITKKEGINLYFSSLGAFAKNSIKNIAEITSFVIKQDWIPEVKSEVKKNKTKNETKQ